MKTVFKAGDTTRMIPIGEATELDVEIIIL